MNGFQQFWSIAKLYWQGDEKWRARGLLLGVVLFLLAYTGLSVILNNKRGVLISALSARDADRFWQTVFIFLGVLVIYAPLLAGYRYLRDRLSLQWRQWLTTRFVDRYFGDRAYYALTANPEIDNPDQRIAEDVRSFTQESLTFLLVVVESILSIVAFSGVLWGISRPLVIFLVLYAVIGTVITAVIFGKPLVRLNFEQLKKEADFRFSLVRIRENAEAIAFYRGEEQESNQVKSRFQEVFENVQRLLIWELNLNVLTNAYEFIPFILPALVVAPAIFAGEMEVGKVTEAQGAFIRVFFSLNVVVARFQALTTFGAGVNRLYSFATALEPEQPEEDQSAVIQTVEADRLEIEHLTLVTPNRQRTLFENLSIELPTQRGLLVMGPSGCGKSSFLRAIAGLWTAGSGTIVRPQINQLLFLPQRPYMVLGTLRDQLLYPNSELEIEDSQLQQVLEQVNLANLAERFGGFDARADWADVLSLGEQQRLTFARVLLNKPSYVILDEATSALDQENEERLYQHLQAIDATFLSVGHRSTLRSYHQAILELSQDRTWRLKQDSVHQNEGTPA
ncbi:ABC transporter ATP-binding protein/permease [Leptolyngbya sp. AN03gr2]|uniref:ABC transporter ATP-binding protein/permease n=1 Tax=unclassified Leptolyngbya TaxID=2650499 RepID=UPI003D31801E